MSEEKRGIRERLWKILEEEKGALFPGARGRISNFKGADAAVRLLSTLPEWKRGYGYSCVDLTENTGFPGQAGMTHKGRTILNYR